MVTAPATPALLAPLIAGYLDYLRDEKRYSVHTIAAARRDLDQFAGYCAAAHIARIEQIDAHLIRDWLGRPRRAGRGAASLPRYLPTLRRRFRHLLREPQGPANPPVERHSSCAGTGGASLVDTGGMRIMIKKHINTRT